MAWQPKELMDINVDFLAPTLQEGCNSRVFGRANQMPDKR